MTPVMLCRRLIFKVRAPFPSRTFRCDPLPSRICRLHRHLFRTYYTASAGRKSIPAVEPFAWRAGKMRALTVSDHARSAQLPEVPTFQELGIAFVDETSWYALFAPKGTRKEIVAKINADLTRILALPDMKEREATLGYRFIG